MVGFLGRAVLLAVGIVVLADGTNRARVDICLGISEEYEWCNRPQAEEEAARQPSDTAPADAD